MGKAVIVKDGLAVDEKINKQTVASAKDSPALTDARVIDMDDPYGAVNQPRMVDTTTKNIPADLSWGIREVFFKATGTAVMSITGTNTSNEATVWFATVSKDASGNPVYGNWGYLTSTMIFTGATTTKNGTIGLVPRPQAADEDMALMGDGTWGLPDSVVNRINMLQEMMNKIITALNSSATILNK